MKSKLFNSVASWKLALPVFLSIATGIAIMFSCKSGDNELKAGLRLYVAQDGNDNWSGRLSKATGTNNDGPFATIERARDEIGILLGALALLTRPDALILLGPLVLVRLIQMGREKRHGLFLFVFESSSYKPPVEYYILPFVVERIPVMDELFFYRLAVDLEIIPV